MSNPIKKGLTRVDLAKMFREMGFTAGAEIGTASGAFAYTLAVRNRKAKLFCVDPYEVYEGYDDFNRHQMITGQSTAHRRLDTFDNVEFVKKYSDAALDDFEDGSLDYVYIDANHSYESVMFDITEWSKKVRSGGIVSGHDYSSKKPGVIQAVNEYSDANGIDKFYVLACNSWYWVKP